MDELRIGNMSVTDTTPLGSMTRMTVLSMHDNKISDLSVLAAMPGLQNLDIRRNRVSDLSVIVNRNTLKRLWLTGNPLGKRSAAEIVPRIQENNPELNFRPA